jgi:TPR repeat protein
MHRLAWAYREGEFGLPVDEAEAWRLLELAEEQGLELAAKSREEWS